MTAADGRHEVVPGLETPGHRHPLLGAAGDADAAAGLLRQLGASGRAWPKHYGALTKRETEVLPLLAAGCSNAEIAERLVISPSTAKTHVSRAMRKVNAHDRAQLVVLAYETGLVVPGLRRPDFNSVA